MPATETRADCGVLVESSLSVNHDAPVAPRAQVIHTRAKDGLRD